MKPIVYTSHQNLCELKATGLHSIHLWIYWI